MGNGAVICMSDVVLPMDENNEQLLKQVTQGYTPEQIKQFSQFANNFGITNEQLSNYGINSK